MDSEIGVNAENNANHKGIGMNWKSLTLLTGLACAPALAQAETGKLVLTGGVSSITGTAGGGITPWAVIGSNATEG